MFTSQTSYRIALLVALTVTVMVTVTSLLRALGGLRLFR